MNIPDIKNDEALVQIIDELKYRLKARRINEFNMLEDFNLFLNSFIEKWYLDSDKHIFATLPKV